MSLQKGEQVIINECKCAIDRTNAWVCIERSRITSSEASSFISSVSTSLTEGVDEVKERPL